MLATLVQKVGGEKMDSAAITAITAFRMQKENFKGVCVLLKARLEKINRLRMAMSCATDQLLLLFPC